MFRYCNACGFETDHTSSNNCKVCRVAYLKAYQAKNKEAIAARRREYNAANKETNAARMKAWAAANKEKRAADNKAYALANKEAIKEYRRIYREKNKEAIKAKKAADYQKNRDAELARRAKFRRENPERIKAQSKLDMLRHPGRYRTNGLRRRFAEQQRVVAWADKKKIKAIYLQAAEFRAAGIDCEVDHIYPLRGKTVSGLHCEFNLQIISTYENRAKQNRSPDHHDHPTPDTNSRGVCV